MIGGTAVTGNRQATTTAARPHGMALSQRPAAAQAAPATSTPSAAATFAPTHVFPVPSAGIAHGARITPAGMPGGLGDYYAPAQGKQGAELLRSLHEIVRNGHTDSGYAQARDGLFAIVSDPNHNDTVTDIYTGRTFSGVTDRKTAFSRGLNTEHTWPQSLGARGIAQSDLHQLLPSDIEINGKRGSLPYGEVVREVWSTSGGREDDTRSRLGYDAQGRMVFEPRDSVRGDIARGLLYFFTRYNMSRPADYTLTNFAVELPTLLKWANEDPVDAVEQRRNDEVQALQHNRNPFIDHPEWIPTVSFPDRLADGQRGARRQQGR